MNFFLSRCYNSGERLCRRQAVQFGFSQDDIDQCKFWRYFKHCKRLWNRRETSCSADKTIKHLANYALCGGSADIIWALLQNMGEGGVAGSKNSKKWETFWSGATLTDTVTVRYMMRIISPELMFEFLKVLLSPALKKVITNTPHKRIFIPSFL